MDDLFQDINCMISVYADDIFMLSIIRKNHRLQIKDLNNGHIKIELFLMAQNLKQWSLIGVITHIINIHIEQN